MSTAPSSATHEHPGWGAGWSVGLRVWVERAGQAILGPGRLELLEGIDQYHSISAAARQLGMSYRRAWELVQSINAAAGEALVSATTGGLQGGGAGLTLRGRWAVAVFRKLQDQLRRSAAETLPRLIEAPSTHSVHVAAAVSLEEALGQLLTDFALHRPTVRVRALFGASDELADQLLAGAHADLFLSADAPQLDRLESAGLVESGSRVALADNTLAVVGSADGAIRIRRPADLPGHRVALADPVCPLGRYSRVFLEGLRLYDAVRERAVIVENSRAVLGAVRAGQADLGLVYGSDSRADGCRMLYRVRRLAEPIRYAGAILRRRQCPDEARELLSFLVSRGAASRFRRCGFLVPSTSPGARRSRSNG
jgi:molybdenum ABC transporter molybdate-binding protein